MIKVISEPLAIISDLFSKSVGCRITYAVDERKNFNPTEMKDMLSMYPKVLVESINAGGYEDRRSTNQALQIEMFNLSEWNNNLTYDRKIPDYKIEYSEDSEEDDDEAFVELGSRFLEKVGNFYNKKESFNNLVLCIDKMYIQTIQDKLLAETIDRKDLTEKVLRDILPYVIKYVETLPEMLPKLQHIMKVTTSKYSIDTLFKGYFISPDNRLVHTRISNGYVEDTKLEMMVGSDVDTKLLLLSAFMAEIISNLAKGNTEMIQKFDSSISFIIKSIIDERIINRFFGVEMFIKNFFKYYNVGSMFDRMIEAFVGNVHTKVDASPLYQGVVKMFVPAKLDNYKNKVDEEITEQILASKMIMQYAESFDIMLACSMVPKSEIRLYAESFFSSDDDLDKEMGLVIDLSRRAAICKIDMEYITTKYSKKDAINNGYMCLQDIRDTRKKLKCQESIERLDLIEKLLLEDIKNAQTFDHKKSRMTINIAYPTGYEG